MSKKVLTSCIVAIFVIAASILSISSCGRNGRMTSITVLPENVSIIPGTSQQYQAQGLLSDGTTFFLAIANWSLVSTAATTIATIDPNAGIAYAGTKDPITGILSASTTTGTVTVTAADPYSSFVGTTSLTVDLLSSITVTPYLPSMTASLAHQFFATGYLVNGTTQDLTSFVTWTTDNTIASVVSTTGIAGTGVVTSASSTAGTVTILAYIQTVDSNGTPTTITGSTILTVTEAPLSSLTISPQNPQPISMATTTTQQFSVTGTYTAGTPPPLHAPDWTFTAFWTSSNTAVATINAYNPAAAIASGATAITVNAIAPGTATITATDPITGIAASTTLTVTP